jgi:hypothetical protein
VYVVVKPVELVYWLVKIVMLLLDTVPTRALDELKAIVTGF